MIHAEVDAEAFPFSGDVGNATALFADPAHAFAGVAASGMGCGRTSRNDLPNYLLGWCAEQVVGIFEGELNEVTQLGELMATQMVRGSAFEELDQFSRVAVGGDDDDGNFRVRVPEVFDQRKGFAGQSHKVREDDVRRVGLHRLLELLQRLHVDRAKREPAFPQIIEEQRSLSCFSLQY